MNHSQTRRSRPACPRRGKEAASGSPAAPRAQRAPWDGLGGRLQAQRGREREPAGRVAAPSPSPPPTPRPMHQRGGQEGPLGPQ